MRTRAAGLRVALSAGWRLVWRAFPLSTRAGLGWPAFTNSFGYHGMGTPASAGFPKGRTRMGPLRDRGSQQRSTRRADGAGLCRGCAQSYAPVLSRRPQPAASHAGRLHRDHDGLPGVHAAICGAGGGGHPRRVCCCFHQRQELGGRRTGLVDMVRACPPDRDFLHGSRRLLLHGCGAWGRKPLRETWSASCSRRVYSRPACRSALRP